MPVTCRVSDEEAVIESRSAAWTASHRVTDLLSLGSETSRT